MSITAGIEPNKMTYSSPFPIWSKGSGRVTTFFVHWNKFGQLLPGASDERRRLTDDVDESLTSKFDEMDKRMSDSNLRPLKLSVKMETNDWG